MQRLEWIDRMRGFAILSVVIQHLTMSFTNDFVYLKIIGIANMGLFFFISGYLMVATCRWTALPDMVKFCRKKLRVLMIPFVTWGILMPAFAFQTAWHPITLDTIVTEWHHPHLWFLLTLMGYSLLFAVYRFTVSHVRHARIIGGVILLVFQVVMVLIWKQTAEFKLATLYWIYFTGGIFMAEYKCEHLLENKYALSAAFLLLIVTVCFWTSGATSLLNIATKIICTYSVIILAYNICRHIPFHPRFDRYIQMCGRESIVIYVAHWPFTCIYLTSHITLPNNELIGFLITASFTVIISLVCIGFHRLTQLMPPVNMLLFGEKMRKKGLVQ